MVRLSHSGKETYINCNQQWKLHYLDRLRSTYLQSSLFFGSAMEEAFGILLLSKKKKLTKEEYKQSKLNPKTVFLKKLMKVNIAGQNEFIRKSLKTKYFNGDYDIEFILNHKDTIINYAEELEIYLENENDIDGFVMQCRSIFKKKDKLDIESQMLYNFINWTALYDKGLKLIDAYKLEVLPKINEVFSIQEEVNLPNENGDFITGYIDFVASFVDNPNEIYIVDNKTSSKAYKLDSVKTSPQLATYCEHKELNKAAYVVVEKKFRKREPRIRITIIKDTIPEETFNETFNGFSETLEGINSEKFDKNMDNCYQYGSKCVYYNYCRNGCDKGLKQLEGE